MKDQFIRHITNRRLSKHTIHSYDKTLTRFFAYIEKEFGKKESDAAQITPAEIDAFLNHKQYAPATFNQMLCTLKAFYKWLCLYDNTATNPCSKITTLPIKATITDYFTVDDCLRLFEALGTRNHDRNRAIVALAAVCGLRREEIVNLNLDKYDGDSITFIRKGGAEYKMPLPEMVQEAIDEYLRVRPESESPALFLAERTNDRLTPDAINSFLSKAERKAGIKSGVHILRHTAASLIYQNTHDIYAVRDILGHANVKTTQRYAHMDDNTRRNAVNSNPLTGGK